MVKNQCFIRFLFHLIICIVYSSGEYDDLKMVHVIFRHGERTPTVGAIKVWYPNDSYLDHTYFPYGPGSLTNDGKRSIYKLGTFLRQRYNDFLGDVYAPGVAKVRATVTHRAMISAQLVNAGLWPPSKSQQWNKDLLWVPIPYEYVSAAEDNLMYSYLCPTYQNEYERVYQSQEVEELVKPHQDLFTYLSEHTGFKMTRAKDVFFLYHTLEAEANYNNLTLPTWTQGYFPDGEMYDVTLLEYDIGNFNDFMKRIYGGPFVREILDDYDKFIHSTETLGNSNPKIKLYSGHESNIASVLKTLGVWFPHVPDFSSAIMFELLMDKLKNEFGVRIVYYTGRSGKTMPLTVPGCTEICPIQKLRNLLSNVIPDDVDKLCGMKVKSNGIRSSLDITLCIALPIWILHFVFQ